MSDGVATVRYVSNPLDASPARRYLGIDPSDRGLLPGQLRLAWGAQWSEGQPLEADVTTSLLQRKIGDGAWEAAYQGPATQWVDQTGYYDSTGSTMAAFRARVQDSQGKLSTWSNVLFARVSAMSGIAAETGNVPSSAWLDNCYPNPFNSSTTIRFRVAGDVLRNTGPDTRNADPGTGNVKVCVFDLLGREVAVLVDGQMEPGNHTVRFDGTGLASGVYLYRLQSGGYIAAKTLLLLR
jgi:hypothetical protein